MMKRNLLKRYFSFLAIVLFSVFSSNADRLSIPQFTIDRNGTATVSISAETNGGPMMEYKGFQFDLFLPENYSVISADLNPSLAGFILQQKDYGNGVYRFIAFTEGNTSKLSSDLLTLVIKAGDKVSGGTKSINIQNVVFSALNGQDIKFDNSVSSSITNVPVTGLTLSAQNITLLTGQSKRLTATISPADATDQTITWKSNSDGIATIDSEGNITALSAGTAIITATCGEATAQCTVTVKGGGDITVTPGDGTGDGEDDGNGWIDGNDVYVHVNRTVNMNLTMPEGLTETPTLTWKLANGGEQYVKLTPSGNTLSAAFTGVKFGETTYTVWLNGEQLLSGKVTVIAEITMNSLLLEPATLTMARNALPVKLQTVYTPENATMPQFSWSSSNPAVATVGTDGTVTPTAQGQTTITATALDGSGLSATSTITVTAPIAESFEFDFDESVMGGKEGISLYLGDTYKFTPKAQDGFVLPAISWSSSDPTTVSVNDNGTINALKLGEATITATATVNNQGVKAECKVTVIPVPLESVVVIAQTTTTLMDGETVQLTAKTEPANATAPIEIKWSSDKPEVASVNESTGLVTAHTTLGTATITATVTNPAEKQVTGSITVTVIATGASRIILNTYDLTMMVGQKNRLTGKVEPANTTNPTITWTIDNPKIATIDGEGNITALSAGTAIVTATCGEATAQCTVTVKGGSDITVTPGAGTGDGEDDGNGWIDGNDVYVHVNRTVNMNLTLPAGLTETPTLTWTLANGGEKFVRLTPAGNRLSAAFTGLTVGETGYKVSVNGEELLTGKVTVLPITAESVTLSAENLSMLIGQSKQLEATVLPENTTDKAVTWTVTEGKEVATVTNAGLVTALSAGTATITATCGGATATCKVTVKGGGGITVTPGSGTPGSKDEDDGNGWIDGNDVYVHVNRTVNMTLKMPEGLTETPTLTWKLANGGEQYVKLTPSGNTLSAAFTGLKFGETAYTVSLNGEQLLSGKVTVIAEITMNSLLLEPATLTMARNALPVKLETRYTPAEATMPQFSWSSSNPAAATVGTDGTVTPKAQGQTTITATALDGSGLSATSTITVTAPIAESFEFDFDESVMGGKEGISLYLGDTYKFTPKAQDGFVLPAISWSSSDPTTVSVNDNGTINALKLGEATITASATVNGKEVKAECKVTVIPVPLESVIVTAQTTTTLMDGETVQLTAKTEPANATQPVTVIWKSDKPEIASVDEKTGLVTAHSKLGKATITATATNPAEKQVTGSIDVTVIETGASRIILNTYDLTMLVGQKNRLTGTVEPATSTNPIINWTIDNPQIATIDSEGNITALSAGTAIVTATCGEAKAECTVTVKGGGNVTVTPGSGTPGSKDEDDGNGWIDGNDVYVHVNRTVNMNLTLPEGLTEIPTLTWTLANGGEKFVRLTPAGNTLSAAFTGLTVGETSYKVSVNGEELLTGKVTVIAEITMNSLLLEPATLTMAQNALPVKIKTVYTPENATMPQFSWSSSNPAVATVGTDGTVTPKTQGQTTIMAIALDGSGLSAISQITVTAPVDEDFDFDQSVMGGVEGVTIFLGESYVLEPKAHEGFVLPSNIVWSSSDDKIVSVDQKGKVTGNSLGSATIFATAVINGNEITASCTVNVVPIKVASIQLRPNTAELRATETLKLTATIEPADATDKSLQWTTNAPSIVTVSQEGVVTAHMVGEANITARATDGSNVSATCKVKVIPTIATGITVKAEGSTTLKATETVELTATVTPETTTDKSVKWKSDKPAVATVSESGVVTAVAVGEANITATNSAGQTSTVKITVIPTLVETIELNRYTAQIRVEGKFRLTANIYPATATDKSVTWSSSNSEIATVDSEGNVTGVALGEAQIICTANDGSGVTAQCRVTVTTTATESISITANGSTTLKATETVQLTATVLPETASDKSVRWQSDNTDIATVDNRGLVTAVSVGTASISATNSGGQTASISIKVVPTPVERIELNKTTASLKATGTLTLIATVYPETATQKGVEWSSSNETIARVTQNGLVTAVAKGDAVITAKAIDGSGVTATCKVSVIATDVTSVRITANGSTTLKAAETVQLTATVLPETATDKSVEWSSSSPGIADVNENGLVTAYAVGKTTITATATSGIKDEITITVEPTLVNSIILNQPSLTMRVTNEVRLTATVLPTTATDKSLTWTSSNVNIATVDADGKVTAVKEGQTSIICTANDGSGVAATCIVNVVDTDVEIVTITAEGPTTLKVSETVQLKATIQPETTTEKTVVWSSGNDKVATVDADGLVTAVSEGYAVITATTTNGLKDQITITVVDTRISGITLNETAIILMANETYSLIPNIQPQTATNKQLHWTTGDESVATVAQDGVVSAIAVGETTVTASATDGSGVFASCKVTVIPTPAESITITVLGSTTLEINQTVQLTAEVLPANATDKSVVWTSSNKTVAEVTENGLVTALTAGEAVITATNSAGQYDRVTMIVLSNEPDQPDVPDVPDVPVKKADTPTEMLRKGNGTSHTFVAMMEKSDETLEAEGYRYVFGYDNGDSSELLGDTPWRYTHTTGEIYWDVNNDFWVFAYYIDTEGTLCVSSRRHLDGSIDDDFDPMDFIGTDNRSGDHITGIYTLDGRYVGKSIDSLDSGIYIVKTSVSSYKIIR